MGKFSEFFSRSSPYQFSEDDLLALIHQWVPGKEVKKLTNLQGGFSHLNTKFTLEGGETFILRLKDEEKNRLQFEKQISSHLEGKVPAPQVVFQGESKGNHFLITRYLEGSSLDEVWDQFSSEELLALCFEFGECLSRIHQTTFDQFGFFANEVKVNQGFDDFYLESLKVTKEMFKSSPHSFEKDVIELIRKNEDLYRLHSQQAQLCHCDFNSKNILVHQVSGEWRLKAVLDWEFAMSGSGVMDFGNFLRFDYLMPPDVSDSLSNGYLKAGGKLNEGWRKAAALMDLVALVELLTRASASSRNKESSEKLIERTLEKWS
jgi:fructokinase